MYHWSGREVTNYFGKIIVVVIILCLVIVGYVVIDNPKGKLSHLVDEDDVKDIPEVVHYLAQ